MKEEDRCCGNCCWFCGEVADGWGQCIQQEWDTGSMHCSDLCTTDKYVSREEMRHHMAEIKGFLDNVEVESERYEPWPTELVEPLRFAYNYMKVFCRL